MNNFALSSPMGIWINPSHRKWEWYYNKEEIIISCLEEDSYFYNYTLCNTNFSKYTLKGTTFSQQIGSPASVKKEIIKVTSYFVPLPT